MDTSKIISTDDTRRGRWTEVVVLAVVFALVNVAAGLLQKPISYHEGRGWEGVAYSAVAEQFAEHRRPVVADAPELYRVGTPFLAGELRRFTGFDLFLCFKLVNGAANALTLALLVVWLRRFLSDWRVRTALGLAFLLQWDTPSRWMYFFPAHTDPWMWVFLLAGLIAVERYRERPTSARLALVAVLTAVGVCFREVVLVVACIVPFVGNPVPLEGFRTSEAVGKWRAAVRELFPAVLPRLIPLLAGLSALVVVRLFVAHQQNDYAFAQTAIHWLRTKPPLTYVQGWFLAFGPLLWLAIFHARRGAALLASHQPLAAYLAAFTLLGYIGGTDTERLLYWTMPVTFVLIGRALEDWRGRLSGLVLALLIGAQIVASRVLFWPIPDYPADPPHAWPLFTPMGRNVPFLDLYSFWEPRPLALISLAEYFVFGAALGILLLRRTRDVPTTDPAATS